MLVYATYELLRLNGKVRHGLQAGIFFFLSICSPAQIVSISTYPHIFAVKDSCAVTNNCLEERQVRCEMADPHWD